jgi:hypothetical protein
MDETRQIGNPKQPTPLALASMYAGGEEGVLERE